MTQHHKCHGKFNYDCNLAKQRVAVVQQRGSSQAHTMPTETLPDGTKVQVDPDGTKLELKPDGTRIQTNTDGARVITSPDGTIEQTTPDGISITRRPDGSVLQQNSDGSVRWQRAQRSAARRDARPLCAARSATRGPPRPACAALSVPSALLFARAAADDEPPLPPSLPPSHSFAALRRASRRSRTGRGSR